MEAGTLLGSCPFAPLQLDENDPTPGQEDEAVGNASVKGRRELDTSPAGCLDSLDQFALDLGFQNHGGLLPVTLGEVAFRRDGEVYRPFA